MFKGFKEFLMRGNVIDLAIAVVIGAAFTAIVTAFSEYIIQPFISALGGADSAEGLGFHILEGNPATFVDLGSLITALINFLIIALVVYFIFVAPMQRAKARSELNNDGVSPATDNELLEEIRDLLASKQDTANSTPKI